MRLDKPDSWDERKLYCGLIRIHILYHASQDEVFGLGMIEELARHGYKLSPGTLYPILHGLEEGGLLRSRERPWDGRIRRTYRTTASGRKALDSATQKIRDLFGEIINHNAGRRSPRKPD